MVSCSVLPPEWVDPNEFATGKELELASWCIVSVCLEAQAGGMTRGTGCEMDTKMTHVQGFLPAGQGGLLNFATT